MYLFHNREYFIQSLPKKGKTYFYYAYLYKNGEISQSTRVHISGIPISLQQKSGMVSFLTLYVPLQLRNLLGYHSECRGQICTKTDGKHLIQQRFDVLLHLGTDRPGQHADTYEHG